MHFDLETLHSYRLRTHTASVRGRPGMVGRPGLGLGGLGLGNLGNLGGFTSPPQICLHANGGPVSVLAATGLVLSPLGGRAAQAGLWERELQDLQGKIETFRTQLREALARRAEIQSSLERERSRLRLQTVNTERSSSAQPKLPDRTRTSQLRTLNNQQPGGPGTLEQVNPFNSLDRGRTSQSADRTVPSRTSSSLERSRQPGSGNPAVQSRNTCSLDRQKANLRSAARGP